MTNNWKPIKLGEVLKLEYGKPLEDRNPNGKYPVYGANGEKTRTDKFYYDKPSIIVGRKGSAGEVNLTEDKFWALDVTYFVTFDESKYDLKFLYNLLLTLELPKLAKGVKPGINRNEVYDLDVTIPSLAEQQRIVAILDEAFASIAQAKENAEKNLQNARELFDSYLQSVFANPGDGWEEKTLAEIGITQTGTTPKTSDKDNYGDFIPFIKPADIDITGNGEIRYDNEGLSEKGLRSGRKMLDGSILMVCIGASIGKVGFVDRDVSCNQQINSLTVKNGHNPKFFYYALSTKSFFEKVIKGSAQATLPIINKGKWEKLSVNYPKSYSEQETIANKLDALLVETKKLENIYRQKIKDLDELKKSILQKAFSGELTTKRQVSNLIDFPVRIPNISATDLQAGIVATAYQRHQESGKVLTFGHVKAEKIVHLAQEVLNIELEREPVKDAAGPNDFPRLLKVQSRAEKAGFFYAKKQGYGYTYTEGSQFDKLIEKTKTALAEKADELTALIDLLVPMNTQQAELVATVYAAWNNLLIDNLPITDEAIVREAREEWHEEKLKIERDKFFNALIWMKRNKLIPKGTGKKVLAKA